MAAGTAYLNFCGLNNNNNNDDDNDFKLKHFRRYFGVGEGVMADMQCGSFLSIYLLTSIIQLF